MRGLVRRWIKKRVVRRKSVLFLAVFLLLFCAALFQPFVHAFSTQRQDQARQPIEAVLAKEHLNEADYRLLLEQTGLGKPGIDGIREKVDDTAAVVLLFQDWFLSDVETECCRSSLFTRQDRAVLGEDKRIPMAELQDGDILLSFSSHSLGWQHGHAALVVDGENMLALEAVMLGKPSKIDSCKRWNTYSNFLVLRLKGASEEARAAIAAFARKNLTGVPYSLTSGLFGERETADPQEMTAQCAYLIWYAFMRFGYDLDSDGGRLVTVADLQASPLLEIVQVFGMEPEGV